MKDVIVLIDEEIQKNESILAELNPQADILKKQYREISEKIFAATERIDALNRAKSAISTSYEVESLNESVDPWGEL